MPQVQVITPPTVPAIDRDRLKAFLRIDNTNDDTLLDEFISDAADLLEGETGLTLSPTTFLETRDVFPLVPNVIRQINVLEIPEVLHNGLASDNMQLMMLPVSSVTSVQYYDENGVLQTLDPSIYIVDTNYGRIACQYGQVWPATRPIINAVQITYVAGYADATKMPRVVRQAMRMLIAHWWEHREACAEMDVKPVPRGFNDICAKLSTGEYR